MGRFIKNVGVKAGSHAIRMPIGNDIIAPDFPVDGQIRFNNAINNLEVYYSGSWKGVGMIGRVAIKREQFTGDGMRTLFVMEQAYSPDQAADILVFVGNVFQNPDVAYSVDGTNLNFTSAPDNLVPVVVLHNFNSTNVR